LTDAGAIDIKSEGLIDIVGIRTLPLYSLYGHSRMPGEALRAQRRR
jgi:hypothetical protein